MFVACVTTVLQLIFGAIAILYAVTPASYRLLPPPVRQLLDGTHSAARIPNWRLRAATSPPTQGRMRRARPT